MPTISYQATRFRSAPVISALVLAMLVSHDALAASQIDIDVNRVAVQARTAAGAATPFTGTNFSGDLHLSSGNNTFLAGIAIDGSSHPQVGVLNSVQGVVHLASGQITGGAITVNTVTGATSESLTLQLVPDTFPAIGGSATDYYMLGALGTATVTPHSLAGIQLGTWSVLPDSFGYFALTGYSPTSSGLDTSANLDLTIFTPEPFAAAHIVLGIAAVTRRRRARCTS